MNRQGALLLLLGTLAGNLPGSIGRHPTKTKADRYHLGGGNVPVVVPVARGAIPYGLQVVWTALSSGDTTSQGIREKYVGRACENSDFFLRRESGISPVPCRALDLRPWLTIGNGVPDSAIAEAAVVFADSMTDLYWDADSTGEINAIVVALVGYEGPVRRIALNYSARGSQRPVTIGGAVIVGLPSDSSHVTDRTLALAMPYVVGLPPTALVEDETGQLHLHPEARLRLWPDTVEVVSGPRTLHIDTEVHSCGSLACIVASPIYRLDPHQRATGEAVYISPRYDRGVLLEAVRPFNAEVDGSSTPIARARWLMATPEGGDVTFALSSTKGGESRSLLLSWHGRLAEIQIPSHAK